MFGLVILFFLFLWVLLTIAAMIGGWKIGGIITERLWGKLLGMSIGFMFLMGWFFVANSVNHKAIQNRLAKLCKEEAKMIAYVTPEEWRKEIGEEEWAKSFYVGSSYPHSYHDSHQNVKMKFNGKEYLRSFYINQRIDEYVLINKETYRNMVVHDYFLYDKKSKKILFYRRDFDSKEMPLIVSLKFLRENSAQSCDFGNKRFFSSRDYSSVKN